MARAVLRNEKADRRIFSILQRRITDPALAKLSIERGETDSQDAGRLALVELDPSKDRHDVLALRLPIGPTAFRSPRA